MKISAAQAAHLIGRNERRIRDWIATQRLPAIKVGQTWQIDTEDLERIPGIKIDRAQLALLQAQEASTSQGLLSRIAELEYTVQCLHSEIASLNERLERLERLGLGNANDSQQHREIFQAGNHATNLQRYSPTAHIPTNLGYLADVTSEQDVELLPPGSIRMKQFALIHKVHAAVLAYQIETGKIEDTAVSSANGRKSHWLTPEQQRAVIAFWRRNGTHFVPCSVCPHSTNDSQAQL